MRLFRTRSALVAGAIGLAVVLGAAGVVTRPAGLAYAEDLPDTHFDGIIEALPDGIFGVWQVSGRQVLVTEFTEIDNEGQALVPGMRVEVEGIGQEAGPVLATEIEVEKGHHADAAPAVPAIPAGVPSIPGLPNIPGLPRP